jgi:hypothetical protein
MKFTLEHALILILAIAVIYYVVQHRNLVKDVLSIPNRDHPELKRMKEKHSSDDDDDCSKAGKTIHCVPVNSKGEAVNSEVLLSYCGYNPNAEFDECYDLKLETPITNNSFYHFDVGPLERDRHTMRVDNGGDMWCNKQLNWNTERKYEILHQNSCEFDDSGFGKVRGKIV